MNKVRYMNGNTPLPERLRDRATHTISLSEEQYDTYTSSDYFIDSRPKSTDEINADKALDIKENSRKQAKAVRNESLQGLTIVYGGNVFQTRLSDEVNFRLSIETMNDTDTEEWILDDNTIAEVSQADLIAVYSQGLAASKAIDQVYKDALKAL
jgi:hypothetical protein